MRSGADQVLIQAVQNANGLADHLNASTAARLTAAAELLGGDER